MKRKYILILLCAIIASLTFALVACDGCNKTDDDTAGGNSNLVKTYNWNGLQDFNLMISDTDCSYSQVTVTDDNGLFYLISVDDSNVVYGQKGEYEVKFFVDEQVKTQKVFIYDLPTIEIGDFDEFSYEQVVDKDSINGLFSFAEAKDCFGRTISVGVEESRDTMSLFRPDGSIEYGDYDITLAAVDAAGQVVREDVSFTVVRNEQTEPTIVADNISVDVIDSEKNLDISLKNREIISISINDKVVDNDAFVLNASNTIATIDISKLDMLELGNQNLLRISTSGGYFERNIKFTDEKEAVMDVAGRNEQLVILGDTPTIVQPKKVYEKQNFNIELSMVSPSGSSIDTNKSTFDANEMGVYVLTATAKRNGVECGKCTVNYTVCAEYNSFRTEAKRSQIKAYKSVFWSDRIVETGKVAYEEEKTLAGVKGNFVSIDFADSSYLGFNIPLIKTLSDLNSLKTLGVEKAFIKVYIEGKYNKNVQSSIIKVGCLDDGNTTNDEKLGKSTNIEPNQWTTLTVNLDDIINNYQSIQNKEMLLFHIYNGGDGLDTYENFKIYFSEMLFELPAPEYIYNSLDSLNGINVYKNWGINSSDTVVHGNTSLRPDTEIGGVLNNYVRCPIFAAYTGITLPSTKSISQIQILQSKGYSKLTFSVYIDYVYSEGQKYTGKYCSVLTDKTNGDVDYKWVDYNKFVTIEISIDDIIANYSKLQDGTMALLWVHNADSSEHTDGIENGNNAVTVYISNLIFTK